MRTRGRWRSRPRESRMRSSDEPLNPFRTAVCRPHTFHRTFYVIHNVFCHSSRISTATERRVIREEWCVYGSLPCGRNGRLHVLAHVKNPVLLTGCVYVDVLEPLIGQQDVEDPFPDGVSVHHLRQFRYGILDRTLGRDYRSDLFLMFPKESVGNG